MVEESGTKYSLVSYVHNHVFWLYLAYDDLIMIFPRPIQTSPKYYCVCYHATRTNALSAAILASSSATAGVLGVATVTPELDFTSSVPQPSLAVVTHWMYLKRVPLLVCREGGVSRPSCVPPTPRLDIPQAPGRFFEGVACPSASGRDPTRVSNQNLQLGNRWVR